MSDFFSDFGQGVSGGLDIASKLQSLQQSKDRFTLQQHQIQTQQQLIDDQVGLNEAVGEQLANGRFDAAALYKRYPRAYREIQDLQAQQAHLVSAGASGPSAQIIQSIQSGDLKTADYILQQNAETIDRAIGRPGAHIEMRQQLRTNPADVLERAKKSYILAKGDPKATGLGNTFNPKALAQTQKIDQGYSDQVDKLHTQVSATDQAAQALDSIIGNLEKAQKSDSLGHPALWREASAHIPGTEARDLREELSPVTAQAYVNSIQQAKAQGANIRITQQEVQVLAKGLGSLDLGQSDSQLKSNINNILTKFKVQRKKLQQDHQRLQTKYQLANQKYSTFQQQSGIGSTLDQSLLGSTQGMQQSAVAPATGAAPATAAAPAQAPMQQSAPVPQSQVRTMQPVQSPSSQQIPQKDLDYLDAHPETADRFEEYWGVNPLKS